MAESNCMPVDDDFDFDLDLTETEMLWEKKILAVTDEALGSGDTDIGKHSNKKDVSMNDVEELTDEEPDLILVKDEAKNNRNKNIGGKSTYSNAMEDLEDIGDDKSSQSPSILDGPDGSGANFATRENSINALRDSLNAFRDEIDIVRETFMKDKTDGNKKTEKSTENVTVYDLSESDNEKAAKPDGTRNIMDTVDEEKAVIVSFYDTIDLTDQSHIDMSSPGEELNTSSSGTVGEDEMNTFVISPDSEKPKSDTQTTTKQSQDEHKKPTPSATIDLDNTYTDSDVPPCQSCLKAKEKRNCTHRRHPYPVPQGQGPSGGQGGARGIGRGALLEQLTEMGVRPAARGRGILSPEWTGLEETKKESKKLKYSVEVQHVREIFPAVHRHFVKKLLKYLADRFSNKETILQHAVTFLSDNSYPMDGDSQWEIDAAIDSLKKVVITPTGVDIPKRKENKSSGERDNFVSNWISQSDFQKALDTVAPSTPSGSKETTGNDSVVTESGGAGATADSRLFGFSNPDTLSVPLGLPLVPSGTSVRSLGTSIASIANSPPASPLSWHGSSASSEDFFGNSPNRITDVVGILSDTSPDSVKHSGTGASLTIPSDSDKKHDLLEKIITSKIINKPPISGETGTSASSNNEFSRPSVEQTSDRSDWLSVVLEKQKKAREQMQKRLHASKASLFGETSTLRSGNNELSGPSIEQKSNVSKLKGRSVEDSDLQKALYASIKQGHSDMEVEDVDAPAARPKTTDSYKEKMKKDQEQFKRAVANYRRLEALKKAAKTDQSAMAKDGAGKRSASSSSLATEGTLRTGDIRSKALPQDVQPGLTWLGSMSILYASCPKIAVSTEISSNTNLNTCKARIKATESGGSGTLRFHPYPQADKHLSADRKSNSTPEFSFAVPLTGNQPDSVNHGQTVSHPDISSSIKDEDMALEEANSVVSSSSINCENCKATQPVINLAQCCDGHLLCTACLEKAAKLILVGNQSGQVICPVTDCGSSVPRSELRKSLHSIMLDLLDEKWNKEAVDAMNEMEDFVRCPDCGYSVILDLNVKMHSCEQCKKKFCRFCSLYWDVKNHDFCIKMKTQKTAEGQGVITVPAHWSLTTDQEMPFQQVTVNESEIEFTTVAELFYATMHRNMFKVEKVYRIQNQRLWEKYMLMRTHMVADLGEMHINEQRLFHGTASEVLPAICKEGFDWRLHGRNGTAFGQGTYFAKDANYSHNYSVKKGAYKRGSSLAAAMQGLHGQLFNVIAQRHARHSAIPLPFGAFPGPPPPITQQQSILHSGATGNQQQSSGFQFGGPGPSAASGFHLGGNPATSSTGFQFGNSNTTGNQPHPHSVFFGGSSNQPPWMAPPASAASSNSGFNLGNSGTSSGFTLGQSKSSSGSADSMTDDSGNFMFVGRVLVGRVCKGTPDMRRPPSIETEREQRMCHTAVNHIHKPTIYVVFDSSQCYPEYLIEYNSRM